MGPIDYSIDIGNPLQSLMGGFQSGLALNNMVQQQATQQQQRARAQALNDALAGLADKPDASGADYSAVMTRFPEVSEQLKRAWDTRSPEQQKSDLSLLSQVTAALHSTRPEIASQILKQHAEALRNSGDQKGAKVISDMATLAEKDPAVARMQAVLMASSIPGGDKIVDAIGKLGTEQRAAAEAPSKLAASEAAAREAAAKATTAEVTARYAQPQAIADLEKKGWDVKAIQSDIEYKKQDTRIKAMQASLAKEGNELKKKELQLKIDEAQQKLGDAARAKAADVEAGANAIDNALNTIERIKKNPSLKSVIGSIQGRLPAIFSDEASNAIALIETLGSQTFLSQLPAMKGTGNISEKEGDKLQSSLTNLARTQGEEQFLANLDEAARILKLGRENIAKRYGLPAPALNTPAAPGSRPPLDSFFK